MPGRRLPNEHETCFDLLGVYVLGATTPSEDRRIERHVTGCSTCRAELAEYDDALRAFQRIQQEPSPRPTDRPLSPDGPGSKMLRWFSRRRR